jgi:enoyl-CoA hydratase/3-hydroxyacyl-CoA dehydrogenase
MENGSKPVVAAIAGTCLGGGLELAMGCHGRVCTPQSQLGLPELNLGLIPGFGGTQRLPRLVGVQKSLEMMLTSTPLKGKDALKFKLVDDMVEEKDVIRRASEIAMEMATFKRPMTRSLYLQTRLEPANMIPKIIGFAEAQAKKTAPNLPHPFACINAVKAGVEYNGEYGLETEQTEFAKVAVSNTSKALIHFFFASKATGKVPGVDSSVQPRKIKKLAVIGAGTMGAGIAAAAMMAGIHVIVKEVNQKFLDAGMSKIEGIFKGRMEKGKLNQDQYNSLMKLVTPSLTYDGFNTCDLVIEAVIEKLDLKQQVFAELEANCNPNCILATNTSTIDILKIGAKTKSLNRMIGLHFFSPAHVMKLLEIIRTDKTDTQVIVDCLGFAKQIHKTPVVVGNCPGFVVNRIFFDYGTAAGFLVDHGVDPYRIDNVIRKFGMPMGPFRMNDLSGVDVLYYAFGTMRDAFADRSYSTPLTNLLVKANRLGEKTGAGYYKYAKGGKAEQDPELSKYVEEARKLAGNPSKLQLSDEEIVEIIFYPAVNEACRVIEEKMVYRVSDIDVASIFGMGYPFYYGGIMKWGETVGPKKIYDKLVELQQKTGLKFFEPCGYLKECAANNKSFYSADRS